MNVIIIEDEILFQKELINLLKKIDNSVIVLETIRSVAEAVKWFNAHPIPDLIFLDIELSDGNSFEIFEKIKIKSPVIFTTAFNDYAIKAFELNSIDYLLKPVNEEKLKRGLNKYKDFKNSFLKEEFYSNLKYVINSLHHESSNYKSRLLVYKGEQLITVNTNDVAYIYSEEKVTFLITNDQNRYIINSSLDALEGQLNPIQFYRANRQFIIHIKSIENITTDFNYKLRVAIFPPNKIPIFISREKSQNFKDWLNK